jgi:predicted nucleic acid-binding protein
VILVDTGPLVALFDPRDRQHARCRGVLRTIREPLATTVPVLTEVFHMLSPASQGSDRVRDFIAADGLGVWYMIADHLARAFELMEQYADHPMDLADASLLVASETLNTRKVFTVDRRDFSTYRVRRGHRHYPLEIVG